MKRSRKKRLYRKNLKDSSIRDDDKKDKTHHRKIDLVTNCIFAAMFSFLLILGLVLRLANMEVRHRTPDERVYTSYATVLATEGFDSTKNLVAKYNSHKNNWLYPPPARFAYTFAIAITMKITKQMNELPGVYVSILFSIASLIMVIIIGIRFFDRWTTLFALMLMVVSPLDMAIARRVWQDGVICFASSLVLYLTCEIILKPKFRGVYLIYFFVGVSMLWIKTSGIAVFVLCSSWIILDYIFVQKRIKSALIFSVCAALFTVLSISVWMINSGGLDPVREMYTNYKNAVPTNEYAINYTDGPWYSFFEGFWLLSPITTILFLCGSLGVLLLRCCNINQPVLKKDRIRIVCGIAVYALLMIVIMTIPKYFKNMRYLSPMYVQYYLFCGLSLSSVIILIKPKFRFSFRAVAFLIFLGSFVYISVLDYHSFKYYFVEGFVTDPVNKQFKQAIIYNNRVKHEKR